MATKLTAACGHSDRYIIYAYPREERWNEIERIEAAICWRCERAARKAARIGG